MLVLSIQQFNNVIKQLQEDKFYYSKYLNIRIILIISNKSYKII